MLVKGFPVTSWGLPSSPLTSYGFQNSSRLRERVNHLNRLDTLDYLGISCCLVLLVACCCCACFVRGDWFGYVLFSSKMDAVMSENARFHGRNVEKKTHFSWECNLKLKKKQLLGHHIWQNTISAKVVFHDLRCLLASYCTIFLVTVNYGSKRLIHSTATLSTNTNPQRNLAIVLKELPTCPYKLFRTFASFRNCPSPYLQA